MVEKVIDTVKQGLSYPKKLMIEHFWSKELLKYANTTTISSQINFIVKL